MSRGGVNEPLQRARLKVQFAFCLGIRCASHLHSVVDGICATDFQGIVHRHDAHAFVYVLEGSIVMQVKGGKEVTLTPGQTFYESPKDVHVVSRNASKTTPAKFLVFFVKDKAAPVLKPVK